MVEESARRALDVFDVPLSLGAPKFAVSSTDHFGFESHRSRRWRMRGWVRINVTLRISTNADHTIFMWERPGGRWK